MSGVQVLLSTYDGERFLEPQLDSIFGQTYRDVEVLARDDGSRDRTWQILERRASCERIRLLRGENIGVVRSFFELLERSDADAPYLALADQDDVWLPGKVERAVTMLSSFETAVPALYFSRLTLVDEALRPLGHSAIPPRGPSFANALVQSIGTGCTMVMNQAARSVLLRGTPAVAWMHDWWIYLVVAAFGRVVYDPEPCILYRQHAANAVGAANGRLHRWAVKANRFARRGFALQSRTAQAAEFRRIFGAMLDPAKHAQLDRFLNSRATLVQRLRLVAGSDVVYQSRLDDILFKGLVLLNRI